MWRKQKVTKFSNAPKANFGLPVLTFQYYLIISLLTLCKRSSVLIMNAFASYLSLSHGVPFICTSPLFVLQNQVLMVSKFTAGRKGVKKAKWTCMSCTGAHMFRQAHGICNILVVSDALASKCILVDFPPLRKL